MASAQTADAVETAAIARALFQGAAQAIIGAGREGRILFANRRAWHIFGYKKDEIVGQPFDLLLAKDARRRHRAAWRACFRVLRRKPPKIGLQVTACRKDGSEFPIEISLSRVETVRGPMALAFVSDISDRKRAEDEIRCNRQQLRAVNAVRMSVEEASRQLLARELHDVPAQKIALLAIQLSDFSQRAARRVSELQTALSQVLASAATMTGNFPDLSARLQRSAAGVLRRHATASMPNPCRQRQSALRHAAGEASPLPAIKLAPVAHDNLEFSRRLGAAAAPITTHARHARAMAARFKAEMRPALSKMTKQIAELAESIHDLSRRLHPSFLYDLGLPTTLQNESASFRKQYGIPASFVKGPGVPARLQGRVALALYRIAQEAMHNAARHAAPKHVRVALRARGSNLVLEIADDGVGFDVLHTRRKGGLGLISMEERARMVGGTMRLDSRSGKGTLVEVKVPLAGSREGSHETKVAPGR
jgi:PAS domain S-box-containing protein